MCERLSDPIRTTPARIPGAGAGARTGGSEYKYTFRKYLQTHGADSSPHAYAWTQTACELRVARGVVWRLSTPHDRRLGAGRGALSILSFGPCVCACSTSPGPGAPLDVRVSLELACALPLRCDTVRFFERSVFSRPRSHSQITHRDYIVRRNRMPLGGGSHVASAAWSSLPPACSTHTRWRRRGGGGSELRCFRFRSWHVRRGWECAGERGVAWRRTTLVFTHRPRMNAYIYITAGCPGLVALGSQFCSSSSRTRYELHSVALSTLSHAPPCVLKRSNRSSSSLMRFSLPPPCRPWVSPLREVRSQGEIIIAIRCTPVSQPLITRI